MIPGKNLEGHDQAFVLSQYAINTLIRQYWSLTRPARLPRLLRRDGTGIDRFVAGIPEILVDVDASNPFQIILCLPVRSGTLTVFEDSNPENLRRINYTIENWSLAFPVHIGNLGNRAARSTEFASEADQAYRQLYNRLKDGGQFTIWEWLMQIGLTQFGELNQRYSSFGNWGPEDWNVDGEGDDIIRERPASFAEGKPRDWVTSDPGFFQNFKYYLEDYATDLWEAATLSMFDIILHGHSKEAFGDFRPPSIPATSQLVQTYAWQDPANSNYQPRTGRTGDATQNYICFLEMTNGREGPRKPIATNQGNWTSTEPRSPFRYGVYLPPAGRSWPLVRVWRKQNAALTATINEEGDYFHLGDPTNPPDKYDFQRFDNSHLTQVVSIMKDRAPEGWDTYGWKNQSLAPVRKGSSAWIYISCNTKPLQTIATTTFTTPVLATASTVTRLDLHPESDTMIMESASLFAIYSSFLKRTQYLDVRTQGEIRFKGSGDALVLEQGKSEITQSEWYLASDTDYSVSYPIRLVMDQYASHFKGRCLQLWASVFKAMDENLTHANSLIGREADALFRVNPQVPRLTPPLALQQARMDGNLNLIWGLVFPRKSLAVDSLSISTVDAFPAGRGLAATNRWGHPVCVWWIARDGSVTCTERGTGNQYQLAGPGAAARGDISAVSCDKSRLDVFWIAPDGSPQCGSWHQNSGWTVGPISGSRPGVPGGCISATVPFPEQLEVTWISPEGRIEQALSKTRGSWTFSALSEPGVTVATHCMISYASILQYRAVFWVTASGAVDSYSCWDKDQWQWRYHRLAGPGSVEPATVRFAAAGKVPRQLVVWYATPSGGIQSHSAWEGAGNWTPAEVAPAHSAIPESLCAISRYDSDVHRVYWDLFWMAPDGIIHNVAGEVECATYKVHDFPRCPVRAGPNLTSPIIGRGREGGMVDIFFQSPTGYLMAGTL